MGSGVSVSHVRIDVGKLRFLGFRLTVIRGDCARRCLAVFT